MRENDMKEIVKTQAQWKMYLTEAHGNTKAAMLEEAKRLYEYQQSCASKKGGSVFAETVKEWCGYSRQTAVQMAAVGGSDLLDDNVIKLPESWITCYELATLTEDQFYAIPLDPSLTRKQVRNFKQFGSIDAPEAIEYEPKKDTVNVPPHSSNQETVSESKKPKGPTTRRTGDTLDLRLAALFLCTQPNPKARWTDQDFVEYFSGPAMKNIRKEADEKIKSIESMQRHFKNSWEKQRAARILKEYGLHHPDFKMFGWEPDDGVDALKDAYKRKAKELHPDKGGDTAKFQEMKAAYEQLLEVAGP